MTRSRHNVPPEGPDRDALLPDDMPPRELHLNLAHHSGHDYHNPEGVAPPALGLVESRRCPRCWSPCEAFPTLLLNAGRSA
jgi:hypothetical protein